MRPLSCSVDWHEGYSNLPSLKIVVDKYPNLDDLRYQVKNDCYFAEKEGYVSFFHYEKPGAGYGGREFNVTMLDGTVKTLVGPWSSRAGVMNDRFIPQCLDVALKESGYERTSLWFAGHVSLPFALEAIERCEEDIELVVVSSYGEHIFVPQYKTRDLAE